MNLKEELAYLKKTAFLFPGQGSQYVGMGKKLFDQFPIAKQTFEEANEELGFNLTSLCFEGTVEELQKTAYTQPAILTHSVAAYRVFMQEVGVHPHYMAGHSLGEITALTCSGSIAFSDAVKLVHKRGTFMQNAVAQGVGAMSAISDVDAQIVKEVCKEIAPDSHEVVISNYNSPNQTIISGTVKAVENAEHKLQQQGANVFRLNVSAPFHCSFMKEAAQELEAELSQLSFFGMKFPIVSNIDAVPYSGSEEIVHHLTAQMVLPVQWSNTMSYLIKQGVDTFIELGPSHVLRNMMRKTFPEATSFAYDMEEDAKAVRELFQSVTYPCFVSRCLTIAVCTKNNNWNQEKYQEGVITPYRRVQTMLQEIKERGETPTLDQKRYALEMLRSVFITKRTPASEQQARFRQLYVETNDIEMLSEAGI
ncbi:ACP S-malonyltransferase [Paenibacillus sp. SI8]|uniref:ACP S-malonyltransferase n=1 Tax=unclassified Paenibacillus TaxID=185978 RepID=UPI00346542CE